MADGSIEFDIELDSKNAERELQKIALNVKKLEAELQTQQARKTALEKELEAAGMAADSARYRLQELLKKREQLRSPTGNGNLTFSDFQQRKTIDTQIKEQEALLKDLTKNADEAAKAVGKIDEKIIQTTDKLKEQQKLGGELVRQTEALGTAAESAATGLSPAMEALNERVNRLTRRIGGLVKRVFFFSVITMGLRSIRSQLTDVIRGNDEARAALGRLKGALLTLAAPLIEKLLPAFVQFVDLLTRAAAIAAQGVALLLGVSLDQAKTSAEALASQNEELDKTKKSADKAKRALASFDEINKLTFGKDSESKSDKGEETGEILPSFDFEGTDNGTLERILALATLIGEALAAWKIGAALGLGLEQTIGLMLALYSASRTRPRTTMWTTTA